MLEFQTSHCTCSLPLRQSQAMASSLHPTSHAAPIHCQGTDVGVQQLFQYHRGFWILGSSAPGYQTPAC